MTPHDLDIRLKTAAAITRDAGKLALDFFHRRDQLEVELKGMQDQVSLADRATEDVIREGLSQAFPDDAIIGEEGGTEAAAAAGPLWIIDPIDGTMNFLRGVPFWTVAVALVVDRRLMIGITYDPVHDELFTAKRGGGAFRNGRAIKVSGATDPKQAMIGATFSFKMSIDAYGELLTAVLGAGADHRRFGSTALMMAHVADGRLDACATLMCNSWDVIGGLMLVEEAGGIASDFQDGAALDQPNRCYGTTPGLLGVIQALPGMADITD
ncbi:MAG: inositol monophosphatase [Alphaproteobacteria bacterium]|nr:inositol monophosphatase [Alphaproteobacteria bacterium]